MLMLDIDLMKINVYVDYGEESSHYVVEQDGYIEKLNYEQMIAKSYLIIRELVEYDYIYEAQAFLLIGDWIAIKEILQSIKININEEEY